MLPRAETETGPATNGAGTNTNNHQGSGDNLNGNGSNRPTRDVYGLAARGWPLFQVDHPDAPICQGVRTSDHDPATCTDRGKHPVDRWSVTATTDPGRLAAITSGATVNMAIACGPARLVVIDQDRPDGLRTYAASIGETLPATFEVTTHDGRSHLYFQAPDTKIGNPGTLKRLAGCDVRGAGGYVVAPLSKHASGQEYTPVDWDAPVAPMPPWLLALLTAPPVAAPVDGASSWGLDDQEVIRGKQPDRPGERHDRIQRYASSLREHGIPALDAQVLVAAMQGRCEQPPDCMTPFTPADAEAIRADTYRRYQPGPSASARNAIAGDLERQLRARYAASGSTPSMFAIAIEADQLAAQGVVTLEPAAEAAEPVDPAAAAYDAVVQRKATEMRVMDDARALNARRTAEAVSMPVVTSLRAFLAVPDEPVAYRVKGLLPIGARAILNAQFKAGKSTVVGNLARALADLVDFLDHFPVAPFTGSIVIIDDELDERTLRRWLRDQGVVNVDRVHVVSLRGRVSEFNLLDPTVRARWATVLRGVDAAVLIMDCLRPVLDALGLSEDKDAGRFLVAFDALLAEAEVGESVLVHHMGHNGERSRGDSRLLDWPDATWRLVRQAEPGEEPDPAAPRFLSAYGRDVDVPEGALTFDPATRHLTYAAGNRKDAKVGAALPAVLALLDEADAPMSGAAIEAAMSGGDHGRTAVRKAIRKGVENTDILVEDGDRGAHLHSLNPSRSPARRTSPRRAGAQAFDLASSPIGASGEHTTSAEEQIQLATGEVDGSSDVDDDTPRSPPTCRVCGARLLAPTSRLAGICDRRDDEHQAARGAA